jgi:hypothetical protein
MQDNIIEIYTDFLDFTESFDDIKMNITRYESKLEINSSLTEAESSGLVDKIKEGWNAVLGFIKKIIGRIINFFTELRKKSSLVQKNIPKDSKVKIIKNYDFSDITNKIKMLGHPDKLINVDETDKTTITKKYEAITLAIKDKESKISSVPKEEVTYGEAEKIISDRDKNFHGNTDVISNTIKTELEKTEQIAKSYSSNPNEQDKLPTIRSRISGIVFLLTKVLMLINETFFLVKKSNQIVKVGENVPESK